MKENKKALLSGKLSGTRSFASELEQLQNPDDIEKFLLYFSKLKLDTNTLNYEKNVSFLYDKSKIKYINDDQDLLEINNIILNSEFISIYVTETFTKLFITIDSGETFVIKLNKVSSAIIGTFISKDKPIKYAINSFNFIKWCTSKNIDIKNLFDIPTYIKLLTNDVDPFKTIESYLTQYTTYKLDDTDTEKNNITISRFIYLFGKLLSNYIKEFDLDIVSKLINENSYYEGNSFNNTGNCVINIFYTNVDTAISNFSSDIFKQYEEKAYIISPLNRIAPKFRSDINSLINDVYAEDLSITILNELYNNNIPVTLDYQSNTYIITCKYKNFTNVINVVNAIFTEAFFTIFDQTPEMHIECVIKE